MLPIGKIVPIPEGIPDIDYYKVGDPLSRELCTSCGACGVRMAFAPCKGSLGAQRGASAVRLGVSGRAGVRCRRAQRVREERPQVGWCKPKPKAMVHATLLEGRGEEEVIARSE